MGDTYSNASDADADRAQQKVLLKALNAWDRSLRRDACGAWTITGKQGSIHTWGDGRTWVLCVTCRSSRHWTATKGRLSFCKVTLEGDDEGCLRLFNLPTPDQAAVIRDVLCIRKRVELDPDELVRRQAMMKSLVQRKRPASNMPGIG